MLREKELHLNLQLPAGREVWSRRVVQTLNAGIDGLVVDLEQTPDAAANRDGPTITRSRRPVRGDHRARDEVPAVLQVVVNERTERHLIDELFAGSGPNVVCDYSDVPGPLDCRRGGRRSPAHFVDPQLIVCRSRLIEPRADTPGDPAGVCG